MASRSFALIALLAAQRCLVSAQGVALSSLGQPDVAGPTAAPTLTCGSCFIVADVAGVVFGQTMATNTVTVISSIGVGNNGTNITTSYTAGTTEFSFGPSTILGGGFTGTAFDAGPTITIPGGAVLASPTVYNVFDTYTIVSTVATGGSCVVDTVVTSLATALPVVSQSGVDSGQFYTSAEEDFISEIGIFTCSVTGNVQSQTRVQLTESTTVSTTIGPIRLTPVPQSLAASATITTPVVIGNVTFLPTAASQTIIPFHGSGSTTGRNTVLLTGAGLVNLLLGLWAL